MKVSKNEISVIIPNMFKNTGEIFMTGVFVNRSLLSKFVF